jgi:hypothetical protein
MPFLRNQTLSLIAPSTKALVEKNYIKTSKQSFELHFEDFKTMRRNIKCYLYRSLVKLIDVPKFNYICDATKVVECIAVLA